ncbi:uncharacterized protein LOC133907846 [Phragmites australis]|uniref:uncharacterized protein LOC133907846 n=1 Tax=Phragmites australis TaxID=29695 RepID=UPI002D7A0C48|nr:uncharacterized protein LOC133907846 [Phragmites australis]
MCAHSATKLDARRPPASAWSASRSAASMRYRRCRMAAARRGLIMVSGLTGVVYLFWFPKRQCPMATARGSAVSVPWHPGGLFRRHAQDDPVRAGGRFLELQPARMGHVPVPWPVRVQPENGQCDLLLRHNGVRPARRQRAADPSGHRAASQRGDHGHRSSSSLPGQQLLRSCGTQCCCAIEEYTSRTSDNSFTIHLFRNQKHCCFRYNDMRIGLSCVSR